MSLLNTAAACADKPWGATRGIYNGQLRGWGGIPARYAVGSRLKGRGHSGRRVGQQIISDPGWCSSVFGGELQPWPILRCPLALCLGEREEYRFGPPGAASRGPTSRAASRSTERVSREGDKAAGCQLEGSGSGPWFRCRVWRSRASGSRYSGSLATA
jgi:hypothetical protein